MSSAFLINVAPTGMMPRRAQTPHVPFTADEIANDASACADLGAAIIHVHARDQAGQPDWRPESYARIVAAIRARRPDLIVTASTSGRLDGDVEKRGAVLDLPADLRPDMASLTLGSLNFIDQASVNAPATILRLAETMKRNGIKPELEIFDLGMVNMMAVLIDKGLLDPPYYVNLMLGNIGTAQATLPHLAALMADLPRPHRCALAGIGRTQTRVCGLAAACADGVRMGLEDNIWFDGARTRLATNADLVARARAMATAQERPVATPAEVRTMLALAPST